MDLACSCSYMLVHSLLNIGIIFKLFFSPYFPWQMQTFVRKSINCQFTMSVGARDGHVTDT